MKCFGGNIYGSLGQGDLIPRGMAPGDMGDNLPAVPLSFGDGGGAVSNAFAGTFHTCVSGAEGGLACFGYNHQGQVRGLLLLLLLLLLFFALAIASNLNPYTGPRRNRSRANSWL